MVSKNVAFSTVPMYNVAYIFLFMLMEEKLQKESEDKK